MDLGIAGKIMLVALHMGYVTFYNPEGKTLACPGQMGEPKSQWKWDGQREGVAHRWLPCGSKVYVRIAGRTVRTVVLDRGPYMAIDAYGKKHLASPPKLKKWWMKKMAAEGVELQAKQLKELSRTLPDGWRWRSSADILYSLKDDLGTKGGRQPGEVLLEPQDWEKVKELQPDNDQVIEPQK